MVPLVLCVVEPFTSPVWGSGFAVFSGESGNMIPERDSREYIAKACKYAKRHQVYLVPERFMLMGYQCMCIISPDGKVLGAQKCLYWNTESKYSKHSTAMEVVETEFGGVFLCVDVDVYRPEVAKIAQGMGAHILICSQQIRQGDYNSNMVVTGVWNCAQSNHLFSIGVSNAFHCACAPRALTPHNDGFLATPNLKMPMTVKIHADDLAGLPRRYCLSRKLYAVHRAELVGKALNE